MNNLHSTSATTGCCLDNNRKTDLLGNLDGIFDRMHTFLSTWQDRYTLLDNGLPGTDLVTHNSHTLSGRHNEDNTAFLTNFSEVGIFRQESVSGMNRLSICQFCSTDNGIYIEIAQCTGSRSDTYALISQLDVQGMAVGL